MDTAGARVMERVPEPELMDDAVQACAYAEADFSQPHDAFVRHFAALTVRPDCVADLGCGPGDVAVRFLRAYPASHLWAVDGAPVMCTLARQRVRAAGFEDRCTIACERLPVHRPASVSLGFDAVVSNSVLHHLADPDALWGSIRRLAKPGAAILVMDLMRPRSEQAVQRLAAWYASGAPAILRRDFERSLRASYRLAEVRAQIAAAGLGTLTLRVASDRHWIASGFLS